MMVVETKKDETYNGWKNYPTWAVNLWLSNEEPLYRDTLYLTQQTVNLARHHDNIAAGIWSEEEAVRFTVADAIKAWVNDDLAPDLGATFAADLLGYALELVDWHEIADAWIESVSEQ